MPIVEVTRTPATARKRAKCQASATGSLSLLAVPKLKAGDSVKLDAQVPVSAHAGCNADASKHKATRKASEQQTSGPPAVASAGKENQSAKVSWSANIDSTAPQPPSQVQQTATQKTSKQQATDSASQQPQAQHVPMTLAKPSSTSQKAPQPLQAAASLPGSYVTATNGVRSVGQSEGAAVILSKADSKGRPEAGVDYARAAVESSSVKHDVTAAAMPLQSPALAAEAEQQVLVEDEVPLACQTAINKRRYDDPFDCVHCLQLQVNADCAIKQQISPATHKQTLAASSSAEGSLLLQASCWAGFAVWRVVHWQ